MVNETVTEVLAILLDADKADSVYLNEYTEEQIMLHCAEEMSEASAALLKLLRIKEGGPVSRMGEDEAYKNTLGELADALSTGYLLARKLDCGKELALIHLNKANGFKELMEEK